MRDPATGRSIPTVDSEDDEAMRAVLDFAYECGGIDESIDWYERAGESGMPGGLATAGVLAYFYATELERGEDLWRRGAAAGDAEAMYRLALAYSYRGSRGAHTDPDALNWYSKAANAGHVSSMGIVGAIARNKGDRETAIHWFRRLAEAGDPYGQQELKALGGKPSGSWWRRLR